MRVSAKVVPLLIAGWSLGSGCGASLSPDGGGGSGPPYHLVRLRSLASPVPDPAGIAFDGQMLWLVGGAYSPPDTTATLVRFDPDQLTVDRSFTMDNPADTPGSGVYGITWDGSAIWISVAGNRNELVSVDPASGQITRTMSSPTTLGPSDLDFDGSTLWVSSGTGDVFALDPTTGGIDRMLPIPDSFSGRDHGVAVRPGQLWVGGLFGGMGVEDSATGTALGSVLHDDGTAFAPEETGAALFVGDALVIANGRGITYYSVQ
jgi:hypothetical protein